MNPSGKLSPPIPLLYALNRSANLFLSLDSVVPEHPSEVVLLG